MDQIKFKNKIEFEIKHTRALSNHLTVHIQVIERLTFVQSSIVVIDFIAEGSTKNTLKLINSVLKIDHWGGDSGQY